MPSLGQNGGAMNDSLAQHSAQTPSPSTGSRQATHSVGSAMSSASCAACTHAPRHAFSAPRRWVEMERDGDASASMSARLASGRAALKPTESNFRRSVPRNDIRARPRHRGAERTDTQASPSHDALARARPVGEPCVARAIGQAFERRIAAKTEIGSARSADRPAASLLAQLEQRAAMSVVDRLVVRRRLRLAVQCLEHLILEPWHRFRALSLRGSLSRRAPCIADFVARQIEAGEFADDGIAAHPDIVGNLAAGQACFKAILQEFEAFGRPGAFVGGHADGPQLRVITRILLASLSSGPPRPESSLYGVLPLSRIASSPSLMASRMPSSIRVLATPGTLVPWVPCLTSFSR